jgi:hypothetical protein
LIFKTIAKKYYLVLASQINERKAMRKPVFTLAFDNRREKPVASLILEKGCGSLKTTELFNCVQTNFSKDELRNIINPLDDFG